MLAHYSRSPIGFLQLALTLAAALAATAVTAAEVWVITDQQYPVRGKSDRLIELDAPTRIEAELSAQLPNDPEQAAALVQRRLHEGGKALQQRLAAAYQGVTDAWSLGITKVPAVVVDQRYVVYGEADVSRALARVEQYRREQP
ncbi:MAG: TIGR03757 family integrating conjugative element protein [Pseudomonas sp.]|nr:TIGR03757 family integrating conjugative element protein [Pseudomonas sp.]